MADDYVRLLDNAVTSNESLYAELVGEKATDLGLDEALQWQKCTMSINSPVDCGLTDSKDPTWMIAAHNPSDLEQRYIRLQAPFTAAYKVFVIDENQEWKWTPTDMLCFEATENNSEA